MIFANSWPISLALSWRLLRSGHAHISLFAGLVFLSLSLGSCVLVVVASVMNGMAAEIETKVLRDIPHAELVAKDHVAPDWDSIYARTTARTPSLVGAYSYRETYALLGYAGQHTAVKVRAVGRVYGNPSQQEHLRTLHAGEWRIAINAGLAGELDAREGSELQLLLDKGTASPLGTLSRQRYFTVSAIAPGFNVEALPVVWVAGLDGARLFDKRSTITHGLALWHTQRAYTHDARVGEQSQHPWNACCAMRSMEHEHHALFAALRLEKRVVGILLLFVLLVATLNLVSMFGLLIKYKTHSVVMLMTLGMSRALVYRSLAIMGMTLGIGGVLCGLIAGTLVSIFLDTFVNLWQTLSKSYIFSAGNLYIDQLPVQIWWQDIFTIGGLAIVFCIPAILLPLRAVLALRPAEVLRHV